MEDPTAPPRQFSPPLNDSDFNHSFTFANLNLRPDSQSNSASSSRPHSSDGHERPQSSHTPETMDTTSDYPIPGTRPSKFKFKDKEGKERHRSSRDRVRDEERGGERERSSSKRKLDTERSGHERRRHREERPIHRTKRSRHTSTNTSTSTVPPLSQPQADGAEDESSTDPRFQPEQGLDPDTLFRESLFDAMADDEGAAFWSGVYDVPIQPTPPLKMDEEKGVLEQMTEEEYAAHIREQMWRKTNAAFLEEKERREERRKREARVREEEKRKAREQRDFEVGIEESLRRGRERKQRLAGERQRRQRWVAYTAAWEKLTTQSSSVPAIPWPVMSGRAADVERAEVEKFYMDCAVAGEVETEKAELAKVLKTERVRWHPDKMQQKLGMLDSGVLEKVVEVFQIVDGLWGRYKDYA